MSNTANYIVLSDISLIFRQITLPSKTTNTIHKLRHFPH